MKTTLPALLPSPSSAARPSLKKAGPSQVFSVFLAQDGNCVPAGIGGTYYVVLQDVDMSERFASSPVALR